MPADPEHPYVSRGGLKLATALASFDVPVDGAICADLGCSTGGFTDVLLRAGAATVHAVDTGYGVLDWRLRNEPRVVVRERTNAMHVELAERVNVIVADAGWTRQNKLLPTFDRLLCLGGNVVTLVKPHYEADASSLRATRGTLPGDRLPDVLAKVRADVAAAGFVICGEVESPVRGSGKTAGNREFLWHLRRA